MNVACLSRLCVSSSGDIGFKPLRAWDECGSVGYLEKKSRMLRVLSELRPFGEIVRDDDGADNESNRQMWYTRHSKLRCNLLSFAAKNRRCSGFY